MQKHTADRAIHAAAVRTQLKPLRRHLDQTGVYEVAVNAPGRAWVETAKGWTCHDDSALSFDLLMRLAASVASYSAQGVLAEQPLLSATLPDGERMQVRLVQMR